MSHLDLTENLAVDELSENETPSDAGVTSADQENRNSVGPRSFSAHDAIEATSSMSIDDLLAFRSLMVEASLPKDPNCQLLSSSIDVQAFLRGRFTRSDEATKLNISHKYTTENINGTVEKDTIGIIFYRRNKFKVHGNVVIPTAVADYKLEKSNKPRINTLYAKLSAIESIEGHSVRILQTGSKTRLFTTATKTNSSNDQRQNIQNTLPESNQELPHICLWQDQREPKDESSTNSTPSRSLISKPIFWDKLQFRHATTKKRGTWQYFYLQVTVMAVLEDGTSHVLNLCQSSAVTVRGRSPQSFPTHAKKTLKASSRSSGKKSHSTRYNSNIHKNDWNEGSINMQTTDYRSAFSSLPSNLLLYDFSDLGIWNPELDGPNVEKNSEGINTLDNFLENESLLDTSTNNLDAVNSEAGFLIPSETNLLPNVPNLESIFNLPKSMSSFNANCYPHPHAQHQLLPGVTAPEFNNSLAEPRHFMGVPLVSQPGSGQENIMSVNPENVALEEQILESDDERKTYSYEYIPLSINDWTVPVDTVYVSQVSCFPHPL